MKKNAFTLIEMLVVIAIIGILAAMLSGPLMSARVTALKANCASNLRGMGTALFQYESPSYYDKVPSRDGATLEAASDDTVKPIQALYASGLLDNIKNVYCPVGGSTITFADSSGTDGNGVKTSNINFLFTQYYTKSSKSSRVIAADAGGKSTTGGYADNHSAEDANSQDANALFKDNHVKACAKDGTVEGASDTGKIWTQGDLTATSKPSTDTKIGKNT